MQGVFLADGNLESPMLVAALLVFDVLCIGAGVALLRLARRGPDRSLRRSALPGWALAVGSLLAALLMVEAVLHLVPGLNRLPPRTYVGEFSTRPSEGFVADPLTGWRMRSGYEFRWQIDGGSDAYRANDVGFRSVYDSATVSASPHTVVLVGDSFAFGTGVEDEETFGALIDAALPGALVYNIAMPGFAVDQMWMTVRHRALPLRPTAIIVAFVDHDLDRTLEAFREDLGMTKPTFVIDDLELRPKRPTDRPPTAVRWLERRSAIWSLIRGVIRNASYRRPVGEWWHLNSAAFERMHEEASEQGVPIIFVRLPQRAARPFPQLARFMDRLGATYMDLNETPERPRNLHFATDEHINEEGHRFVARVLTDHVRRVMAYDEAASQ